MTAKTFSSGPTPNTVRAPDGSILTAPDGWILLPPGDAALTRRVKAAGDHWVVAEKKGRKVFSKGVWASAAPIDRIRTELEVERATEGFAKRKEAEARRRVQAQAEYVEDFLGAVVSFLAFHEIHTDLGNRIAREVTDHTTPVGSGTVARTKRISIEQRAEAAVTAWMRHRTTGHDGMVIPRVKGKRRRFAGCWQDDPTSCQSGIAVASRSEKIVRRRRHCPSQSRKHREWWNDPCPRNGSMNFRRRSPTAGSVIRSP